MELPGDSEGCLAGPDLFLTRPDSYTSPERDLIALEEDCDAGTFLDQWKAEHPGETPTFKEVHHDPNPIRSWPRFGKKQSAFA